MGDKIKNIAEQKLKAFSIGSMGKRTLSKRELEELRKKEDEEAAAHVFQEFVETFEETPINGSKVWVKAGTYDAGARKEDTREKGKLYKPQSRIAVGQETLTSAERAQEYAKLLANDRKPERLGRKRNKDKSNLETFKEELRMIQEEREERHKYKGNMRYTMDSDFDFLSKPGESGSFDNGDPTTTNLYLGNLNPKITEQQLMELFGKYGPLASIKIMWPRSDEEKARGRNCGFVAFMNRKDGERALRNLSSKDIMGYEMKLGWGKSVVIPPHPIYIPPALLELSMPPPPSGLPFNAQPCPKDRHAPVQSQEELEKVLVQSIVKVVIPTDRNLLMLIHRMVEFVIREGPLFEAIIMNREMNNPLFRFLFETQSPAHIYYRWKLFSMMQGDTQKEWNTKEFRMFQGGSIWKPPLMNVYTQGMPPDLVGEDDNKEPSKGSLSNTQRDRLEDIIRNLTLERKKVGEAMVFCIDHSEAADEIAECIFESLSNINTVIYKKVARLYLVNDVLHNCSVKINNASHYRKVFENHLVEIMKQMHQAYANLDGRLKAEGCKIRVMKVLKAWEDSAIYPRDFLHKLHNIFLGLEEEEKPEDEVDLRVEGIPFEDDTEFDYGVPMDGVALLKAAKKLMQEPSPNFAITDVDGIPIMEEDLDQLGNQQLKQERETPSGFIPSRWETVDPDQVEAQAMTTSKWDQIENSIEGNSMDSNQNDVPDSNENSDSRHLTEERRTKLREIEMKAMQYQDELESGTRSLKSGWTVPQQVEHYRRKLLRRAEKEKQKDASKNCEKHKKDKDYDKSEHSSRRSSSTDDTAAYYKDLNSSRKKRRNRSTSDSSAEQKSHKRSYSKSPTRKSHHPKSPSNKKISTRAPSPPTPPRIRRYSPPASSKSKRIHDLSPANDTKYMLSPVRVSKHRLCTPSPPRSSKYSRTKSPSPVGKYRVSPQSSPRSSRYRIPSPEIQKKHRHKHKYC